MQSETIRYHACEIAWIFIFFLFVYQTTSHAQKLSLPDTIVLWDSTATGPESIDQHSFVSVLESIGFELRYIGPNNLNTVRFGPECLFIAPQATAKSLSQDDVTYIMKGFQRGARVITDG